MKSAIFTFLFLIIVSFSMAQAPCDIGTGGVSLVDAGGNTIIPNGCIGERSNFKFFIANLGTNTGCTIPAGTVTATIDFPKLAGNIKPLVYDGPASFVTGYFTWTYNVGAAVLVGINTTAIPFGAGDPTILVPFKGGATGTVISTLNLSQGGGVSNNIGNDIGTIPVTIYEVPIASNQPDQSHINNGTFIMTQSAAPVGATGVWTLVSGSATIATPSSPTSQINGVALGTSATVRWTLNRGTCSTFDDVVVTNNNFVAFRLKVLLQGATFGNPNPSIMRDNLRNSPFTALNYIPAIDPYTNNPNYTAKFAAVGDGLNSSYQTVLAPASMFANGANNAVDWVFIELRDKNTPAIVLGTRSAIVLQDGTVLDIDGDACIKFPSLIPDNYYVAVRHRNHLGAMTATTLAAASFDCSTVVDFTTMTNADVWNNAGYDGYEMATLSDGKRALWAGDASVDLRVRYTGVGADPGITQLDVQNYPTNGPGTSNFLGGYGYLRGDVNMDSRSRYTGVGSDPGWVQVLLQGYGLNSLGLLNYIGFLQQLP